MFSTTNHSHNRTVPQEPFSKMPSGFLLNSSLFLVIQCHFNLEDTSYLFIRANFSFNLSARLYLADNHLPLHKCQETGGLSLTSTTFLSAVTQD